MEKEIIIALIGVPTALATIVGSIVVARINAKVVMRNDIKSKTDDLIRKANSDFKKIKGLDAKLVEKMSNLETSPASTESIDFAWIEALSQFVEKWRIKIDALELFNVSIPSGFYYNFAVYYAFIKKDFITANFFIEKTLLYESEIVDQEKIKIYRWAARIHRLNRNELEAIEYLNKILNIINCADFIKNNSNYNYNLEKAKLLRSRGFCYFNSDKYDGAISDFKDSLRLSNINNDGKLPYCYCGIAMSLYKKSNGNIDDAITSEIITNYEEAIKLEPRFDAKEITIFRFNIKKLEDEKKYYFSELEKVSLIEIYNFYEKNRAQKTS